MKHEARMKWLNSNKVQTKRENEENRSSKERAGEEGTGRDEEMTRARESNT